MLPNSNIQGFNAIHAHYQNKENAFNSNLNNLRSINKEGDIEQTIKKIKRSVQMNFFSQIIDRLFSGGQKQTARNQLAALIIIDNFAKNNDLKTAASPLLHQTFVNAMQKHFQHDSHYNQTLSIEELAGDILSSFYSNVDDNKKTDFFELCNINNMKLSLNNTKSGITDKISSTATVTLSLGKDGDKLVLPVLCHDVIQDDFMLKSIENFPHTELNDKIKKYQQLMDEYNNINEDVQMYDKILKKIHKEVEEKLNIIISANRKIATSIISILDSPQPNVPLISSTLSPQASVASTEGTDIQSLHFSTNSSLQGISELNVEIDTLSNKNKELLTDINDRYNIQQGICSKHKNILHKKKKNLEDTQSSLKNITHPYQKIFLDIVNMNKDNSTPTEELNNIKKLYSLLNKLFPKDLTASTSLPEQYDCTQIYEVALRSDSTTTSSSSCSSVYTPDNIFRVSNETSFKNEKSVINYLEKETSRLNTLKIKINEFNANYQTILNSESDCMKKYSDIQKNIERSLTFWEKIHSHPKGSEEKNYDYVTFCTKKQNEIRSFFILASDITDNFNSLIEILDATLLSLQKSGQFLEGLSSKIKDTVHDDNISDLSTDNCEPVLSSAYSEPSHKNLNLSQPGIPYSQYKESEKDNTIPYSIVSADSINLAINTPKINYWRPLQERIDSLTHIREKLLSSVNIIKPMTKQILKADAKSDKYWHRVNYSLTLKKDDEEYLTNLHNSIQSYIKQKVSHIHQSVVKEEELKAKKGTRRG